MKTFKYKLPAFAKSLVRCLHGKHKLATISKHLASDKQIRTGLLTYSRKPKQRIVNKFTKSRPFPFSFECATETQAKTCILPTANELFWLSTH